MRVLHVVKTSEGAAWAAQQIANLVHRGIDVHVALPASDNRHPSWDVCGATLHFVSLDLPVGRPWKAASRVASAARLIAKLRPDLIHSHFVGTTLMMRTALATSTVATPLIFQVPGPLHLEHPTYRALDVRSARRTDFWIASSACIARHYANAGITPARVFLSYYGTLARNFEVARDPGLRARMGIPDGAKVVGNIAWMYPPKYHLGQFRGIKGHEAVIDAIGVLVRRRPDVVGLLAGGPWGNGTGYFKRLVRRAHRVAGDRILMPGPVAPGSVAALWKEFDCVIHLPISENCGGVHEPLLAGVPVVASAVGGLPEVIIDGRTGRLVRSPDPNHVAGVVDEVLNLREDGLKMAALGRALTNEMFDVGRTAAEVLAIYKYLLVGRDEPARYDSALALGRLANRYGSASEG